MHIFPKLNLQHCRTLYYFAQLMRRQWLEKKDLENLQKKRLRALINHSYHNVPFYHDLFNSLGLKPKDIESVKDLRKIPILTKENVRKNYPDKIIAKGIDRKRCHIRNTTGSTGVPLEVLFDTAAYSCNIALTFFVRFAQGLKLSDKYITIRHKGFHFNNILFKKMGLLNWENISIFDHTENIINSLKLLKPDVISSYPSMLLLLSKVLEEKKVSGINPRLIRCGGESLSELDRNKIGKILNSEIFAQYGTEEFGVLAFECEAHSGYHVISDSVVIEIVKDEKNVAESEEGEIVVTALYNYGMPLIRYKLGDIGKLTSEKCTCGRGSPVLKSIEGRTDDYLILPSGKIISPRMINVFMKNIKGINAYKTIQMTPDQFVVKMVKNIDFNENTVKAVKKHIKDGCLKEKVNIKVEIVKEIPKERTGKIRTVISEVK